MPNTSQLMSFDETNSKLEQHSIADPAGSANRHDYSPLRSG